MHSSTAGESQPYVNNTSKSGCCARRSSLEKKLIALSSCLALLFIGVLVALIVVAVNKSTTATTNTTTSPEVTTETWKICEEEHCLRSGLYFSMNMDKSVDPCNNFHDFVCGNWTKNKPIPEDKARYGVFDDLRDDLALTCIEALNTTVTSDPPTHAVTKAREFFKSCLKTEDVVEETCVDQLHHLLRSVGVAANMTVDGGHVASDFNWTKTLSRIVRTFGSNYVLSFGVGADVMDTSRNMISLDQPSSFGIGRSYLVNSHENMERINAYKNYMQEALCLVNADSCPDMPKMVPEIVQFEIDMAKLTRAPIERRNASTWYFPMSIGELQIKVPDIPFQEYLTDILNGSGQIVDDSLVVIVKEEKYFQDLNVLINSVNQSVVSNYLGWRLVQGLGPSLCKKFRDIKFKFDKIDSGITVEKSIENRCFDLTNSYFGQAVGSLYIEKTGFDESAKQDVEEMVLYLAKAFRMLVDGNDWMDAHTKNASKDKLEQMVHMIGYPDWTRIPEKLNEYYEDLPPLEKDNFYENYQRAMKFGVLMSVEKLGKSNNRTYDWISAASIVNAFYSPSYNSITFPAGILQSPFYGHRLKVLNYGAIGYVIGHEITHGFDDSGRQYDGEGSLRDWWSPDTLTKFTERKNCFVDQYSNITDPLSGHQLNGAQTIGENIADNGGIRESYQAYLMSGRENDRLPGLEEYDDTQLFFISAASIWCSQFRRAEMINQITQGVHSPGMYRAYIPLANTEEFATAFSCPAGSKMNIPEDRRCVIW